MKKYVIILASLLVGCGNQRAKQGATTQFIDAERPNSTTEHVSEEADIEATQNPTSDVAEDEALNDIRFGDWTEEDWNDNDYFRVLRKYLDAML